MNSVPQTPNLQFLQHSAAHSAANSVHSQLSFPNYTMPTALVSSAHGNPSLSQYPTSAVTTVTGRVATVQPQCPIPTIPTNSTALPHYVPPPTRHPNHFSALPQSHCRGASPFNFSSST